MPWQFWVFWLPMLLGVLGTILFATTFNNLNLPAILLICICSLIPTIGYIIPIIYLVVLLADDHEHIRIDTEIGKFINKWYDLGT